MSKRVLDFIRSQINHVRKEGLIVLCRKLCGLLIMVLSVPIVLFIRLIRPLVVIRFSVLQSERIGHFASNTEIYLCQRDLNKPDRKPLDIFYCNTQISNYQLRKMWGRILHIYGFAKWIDKINRLLPGAKPHIVNLSVDRDANGLLKKTSPHLSFTDSEERLGKERLRDLKIGDKPFICFHARDVAYLDNKFPHLDWHSHNYRNSDINSYLPAVGELTDRGYFALRMGSVVRKKLDTRNLRIIDYAINGRTDFLDIYLGAKCRFFLCDTVGTYAIPEIFRKPIAWVNYIPLELAPTWNENYLFIPKKLWLREDKRFLTFREILDSGIGKFITTQQYEKIGIEVVDNTPEEILALAIEMDERLKGYWKETDEDNELQRRFWKLFKPSELNQIFLSRIGADFLRQNRQLLAQEKIGIS